MCGTDACARSVVRTSGIGSALEAACISLFAEGHSERKQIASLVSAWAVMRFRITGEAKLSGCVCHAASRRLGRENKVHLLGGIMGELRGRHYDLRMALPVQPEIRLRRTAEADLLMLHAFELDVASNQLAGTKPRDWPTFQARWAEILADPDGAVTGVTPRVILADGVLVGAVNVSPQDGLDSLGYWIAREHWGRGIATRAVALMLSDFVRRPLMATAAGHNHPSIRVLQKNQFVIVSRRITPETARSVHRETVTLMRM